MCASQHAFKHTGEHAPRHHTHTGTTLATTHTGTLTPVTTLGILATTRAPGVFTPPKLRAHPSAALLPSISRGTTEFTWP